MKRGFAVQRHALHRAPKQTLFAYWFGQQRLPSGPR
jgi:hypothetical protein